MPYNDIFHVSVNLQENVYLLDYHDTLNQKLKNKKIK